MTNWRDKEPTEKQLQFIANMEEFSEYPLEHFTGKTRGEACDWITRYKDLAFESSWAIEHGY